MNKTSKEKLPPSALKETVKITGGFSCTTFCLQKSDQIIYGRNFDFMIGHGHVLTNKSNVTKKALVDPSEKQLQWTSKYGSLTFNQFGREFPFGGMNEVGLVVEQLWLDQTKYPKPDNRYGLSVLQWIQFQLDNAENVDEVISSDAKIRILDSSGVNLHFFITDRQGESASIEFINGVMKCYRGDTLPHPVLTNNLYNESVAYAENPDNWTKRDNLKSFTSSSLQRFHRAAQMIEQVSQNQELNNIISQGFNILEKVSQQDYTQWSIVYDISNLEVYFKTLNSPAVRKVEFSDHDFSSSSPCMYLNLSDKGNSFMEYRSEENLSLIKKVFNSLDMFQSIPEKTIRITAQYPETTKINSV